MRGYPGGTQYYADGRHDSVRTPFAAMFAHSQCTNDMINFGDFAASATLAIGFVKSILSAVHIGILSVYF